MNRWARLGMAAGAVGGAVFAGQRAVAGRVRRTPDPDAGAQLAAEFERSWRLPAHDGGELFVVEVGTGPPLLLSHGVTLSLRAWTKQLRSLEDEGFRVLAFDHRGHGESTVGAEGHGISQLANDVKSIVEGLDLTNVVIVGHSMGGIATQAFCLDHPQTARERVAGIVLLSTLYRSPFGAADPRVGAALRWVAMRSPDAAGVLRARDLGLVLARLGFGRHPQPSHVEATREMILATDPVHRREATAALAGLNLGPRLGEIDRPALVVCGSADILTPLAESRRIAARIPGARLEVVRGGGHMLMLEQPEALDRLIADFAREVQGPAVVAAGAGT